jgi:hypothetical protein
VFTVVSEGGRENRGIFGAIAENEVFKSGVWTLTRDTRAKIWKKDLIL